MGNRHLKIILLFDIGQKPPAGNDYQEYLSGPDWKTDRQLIRVFESLGHEVKLFGIFDDIRPFVAELEASPPDLVFNTCEAVHDDRDYEANVVAILELMKVKFTGANSATLQLCKDKATTKKIMDYHEIRVPRFESVKKGSSLSGEVPYPAIVKPLEFEGSEGISQDSYVSNEEECQSRLKFVHEKLETDAIIEEYIEGKELFVGIVGNQRLKAFPPRELYFAHVPEGEPRMFTFRAKWNEAYRKKWGIRTRKITGGDDALVEKIQETCKRVYRALNINGYARIDLRLTEAGEIVILEANPNPSIDPEEDFALSAKAAGLTYEKLIEKIMSLSGVWE